MAVEKSLDQAYLKCCQKLMATKLQKKQYFIIKTCNKYFFVLISISEKGPRLKMKDEDLEIMEIWP